MSYTGLKPSISNIDIADIYLINFIHGKANKSGVILGTSGPLPFGQPSNNIIEAKHM
jgi:hypothetical protein